MQLKELKILRRRKSLKGNHVKINKVNFNDFYVF